MKKVWLGVQVTPLKNFECPSLLSIAKSILKMSVLHPFPPISSYRWATRPECVLIHFVPTSKRGTILVCPCSISFVSLQSTLPEFPSLFSHPMRGTVLCGPCPSALYPYKALFLSSCPCSRILCEAPSFVVLIHQLCILTKYSSWVPVHLLPQPCSSVFNPEVVHGHPWCHPDSSCFLVTRLI